MVAGVCAVLMVVAAAGALFGWINLRRARAADAEAQHSRQLAEHARGDAEKLVAFLIDDFYAELEPTGRLDTLGRLAHTAVAYYDGLPKELVTPQTQTFRAMAMVREGAALNQRGEIDAAYRIFAEAQAIFEKLRKAGDTSAGVAYGLALALYNQGYSAIGGGRGTPEQLKQAADLLRPLAGAADASRQVKQAYADALNLLSHTLPKEEGVASCEEARTILAGLGALDLSNLNAAAAYADVSDSEARHLLSLGRIEESEKVEHEVFELTEKVLAQRPGDLRSRANRFFAASQLASLADRRHDTAAAADYAQRAASAGEDYARFNPADLTTWRWWIIGLNLVSYNQYERGEVKAAQATLEKTLALAGDPRLPSSLGPDLWFTSMQNALVEAQLGDAAQAEKALQLLKKYRAEVVEQFSAEDPRRELFAISQGVGSRLQLIEGQTQAAYANSAAVVDRLDKIRVPEKGAARVTRDNMLRGSLSVSTIAAIRLGHFAEAEALARRLAEVRRDPTDDADPLIQSSRVATLLAHAITMQRRAEEARAALDPALAYYERDQKAGAAGTSFRYDYAYALYVSALTRAADASGRAKRDAELAEAAKLLGGASAEARQLADFRELAGWIATARDGASHAMRG
jgi:hypothetical protein